MPFTVTFDFDRYHQLDLFNLDQQDLSLAVDFLRWSSISLKKLVVWNEMQKKIRSKKSGLLPTASVGTLLLRFAAPRYDGGDLL